MSFPVGLNTVRQYALGMLNRRPARLLCPGPIITFTFDDFPRTALETGGSLLEDYGARGTYYVAPALQGSSNHLGEFFSSEDLHAAVARGHELGNHTYGHVAASRISPRAFWKDVEKAQAALHNFAAFSAGNFAYPYGDITARAKLSTQAVRSARSVFPGINKRSFDLYQLKANSIYGDSNSAPAAVKLIAENARQCGWLIFYTHDVRPAPSSYGCTPALFERVLQEARKSGAQILPIREALNFCSPESLHT
jgi:peptidoglycan/xylan/chitin deacetylase (PgdA/CDA1 family)